MEEDRLRWKNEMGIQSDSDNEQDANSTVSVIINMSISSGIST